MTDTEFNKLYKENAAQLHVFARRYVRDEAVAEDLIADSFVKLYHKRDSLPPDTSVEAYLFSIVRNSCLDHLKLQKIHARIEDRMADTAAQLQDFDIQSLTAMNPSKVFATEVQRLVWKAEREMPQLTRAVFHKSRDEGKTYQQIADALGITPRRVHTEIQRALEILRAALKDYLPSWLLAMYLSNLIK